MPLIGVKLLVVENRNKKPQRIIKYTLHSSLPEFEVVAKCENIKVMFFGKWSWASCGLTLIAFPSPSLSLTFSFFHSSGFPFWHWKRIMRFMHVAEWIKLKARSILQTQIGFGHNKLHLFFRSSISIPILMALVLFKWRSSQKLGPRLIFQKIKYGKLHYKNFLYK